ncbi:hypothetical protein BDR03DRAFT_957269 [Suillus americanus]|nr:hypothetical protein BDR03DRAFT_957269 [Suillus americanus]
MQVRPELYPLDMCGTLLRRALKMAVHNKVFATAIMILMFFLQKNGRNEMGLGGYKSSSMQRPLIR